MPSDVDISFGGNWDDLKGSLNDMSSYIKGWGDTISAVGIGGTLIYGVRRLIQEFTLLTDTGTEVIENTINLKSVLQATGEASGFNVKQMRALADEMQRTTKFEDEVIVKAETMVATFTNVRGDEFERTIRLAADMAQVMGSDVSSSAYILGKALDSPTQGMIMLRRQGIRFTEEQQELIQSLVDADKIWEAQQVILEKVQSQYGGAAKAAGEAAGGGFRQLYNILDDLYENVGVALVKVLDPLVRVLKDVAEALADFFGTFDDTYADSLGIGVKKFVDSLVSDVQPAIRAVKDVWDWMVENLSDSVEWLGGLIVGTFQFIWDFIKEVAIGIWTVFAKAYDALDGMFGDIGSSALEAFGFIWEVVKQTFFNILKFGVGVLTAIEVFFMKLPLSAEIAWVSIELSFVTTFEVLKKWVTEDIPEYLRWFFDNWKEIFTDIYNLTTQIFVNMADNIAMFFDNLWKWLNGEDTNWEWKGLTEGFESSLKELPRIAERELSPLEKRLNKQLGDAMLKYGEAFSSQYEKNLKMLGLDPGALNSTRGPRGKKAGGPDDEDKDKKPVGPRENYAKGDQGGAQFEDLQALFKRIQQSTATLTPDQARAQKHLETAQETRDHARRGADAQERTANAVEKMGAQPAGSKEAVLA